MSQSERAVLIDETEAAVDENEFDVDRPRWIDSPVASATCCILFFVLGIVAAFSCFTIPPSPPTLPTVECPVVVQPPPVAPPPTLFPHRIESHSLFQSEGNYTWYFDRYDHDVQEDTSTNNTGVTNFPFDVSSPRFLSSPDAYIEYDRVLEYDPVVFRSATVPVLWSDAWGVVHWNREAERQFYHLTREQQQPAWNVQPCHRRKFVVMEQVQSGFFSRYHLAMVLMQEAAMTGREMILLPQRNSMANSGNDDYLHEGINRYFMPLSQCSDTLWFHRQLKDDRAKWWRWEKPDQAWEEVNQQHQFWVLPVDQWMNTDFPRHHPPARKHLFAYHCQHPQRYASQEEMVRDRTHHPHEHIYLHPNPIKSFRSTINREYDPRVHNEHDRLVIYFTWYMYAMWMWTPLPRIQTAALALNQYWASELTDKRVQQSRTIPEVKAMYPDALHHSVAMAVRRSDKWNEDPYFTKHGFFRDLSLYGYTKWRRERLEKQWFSSIFFMSETPELLDEVHACSQSTHEAVEPQWSRLPVVDPRQGSGCRSEAGKFVFGSTPITYNVLAPRDSFTRLGFEQFLVSMEYVVRYTDFAVGHTSSNVGRVMEELMYAMRQVDLNLESTFSVYEDAVDNYMGGNATG